MISVNIEAIGVPVFVVSVEADGGFTIAGINRADAATVGVDAAEVQGKRIEDCVPPEVAAHIIERYSTCVCARVLVEYDELLFAHGSRRWWRTTLTPVIDPVSDRVVQIVGVAIDITERKHAEADLARAAERDPLTGVLNRRGLDSAISDTMACCDGLLETFGFAVIDLDGFKTINDIHGHQIGDAVLRHVAEVLQRSVSPGEVVARLGGDEFALILDVKSAVDLQERLDALRLGLDHELLLPGRHLHVRASLGGSLWESGLTLGDLIGAADADMYRSKHGRRSKA